MRAIMNLGFWEVIVGYRKVASSRLSRLVANQSIFRMFMKGKFDAYVLWPLAQKVQNWIVDRSTARYFTVCQCIFELTRHNNSLCVSHPHTPPMPMYSWLSKFSAQVYLVINIYVYNFLLYWMYFQVLLCCNKLSIIDAVWRLMQKKDLLRQEG